MATTLRGGPAPASVRSSRFKSSTGIAMGAAAPRAACSADFRSMHADDENTTCAAAARGAAESIWVPASLLPVRGACWRAAAEDHIVVTVSVPPEKPEVHLRIDERGAVRSVCVQRWGKVGQADYGYIPFGGEVAAEGRFGDTVIPTALEVGWWYGTPRYNPFFRATISNAVALG
jgi:hypothetical protein